MDGILGSRLSGKRIVVTGAAGFIGSNLAESLLESGACVTGLDNYSTGKRSNVQILTSYPAFEMIEGDIRDIDTCRRACIGADFILHQAALGSVPRSVKDPAASTEVNVNGTLNMMLAARDCRVKRFVYASSSSVYGDDLRLPKAEGNEGRLLSPYAVTKHVNELHGELFFSLYELETVGLRYFNVFGRRQDPQSAYAAVIPLFIRKILHDEQPAIFGDGTQSRDFTYIDNVVQANIRACLAPRECCGQAYNIACGDRVYLIDLFHELCRLLGRRIEPLFQDERPGDIKHSLADITKARQALSYNPEFGFKDGIARTIEWYKRNIV